MDSKDTLLPPQKILDVVKRAEPRVIIGEDLASTNYEVHVNTQKIKQLCISLGMTDKQIDKLQIKINRSTGLSSDARKVAEQLEERGMPGDFARKLATLSLHIEGTKQLHPSKLHKTTGVQYIELSVDPLWEHYEHVMDQVDRELKKPTGQAMQLPDFAAEGVVTKRLDKYLAIPDDQNELAERKKATVGRILLSALNRRVNNKTRENLVNYRVHSTFGHQLASDIVRDLPKFLVFTGYQVAHINPDVIFKHASSFIGSSNLATYEGVASFAVAVAVARVLSMISPLINPYEKNIQKLQKQLAREDWTNLITLTPKTAINGARKTL